MTPAFKNAPQGSSNVVIYTTVSLACHNYCANMPQKQRCVQLWGGWSLVTSPASFAPPLRHPLSSSCLPQLRMNPRAKKNLPGDFLLTEEKPNKP